MAFNSSIELKGPFASRKAIILWDSASPIFGNFFKSDLVARF